MSTKHGRLRKRDLFKGRIVYIVWRCFTMDSVAGSTMTFEIFSLKLLSGVIKERGTHRDHVVVQPSHRFTDVKRIVSINGEEDVVFWKSRKAAARYIPHLTYLTEKRAAEYVAALSPTHPLCFGNMDYKPELSIPIPIKRNQGDTNDD